MAARQKVIFAFAPRNEWNGSKLMRVDQLSKIADLHLNHLYDFRVRRLFGRNDEAGMRAALREMTGAIVIFLKDGGSCFNEGGLMRLREIAKGVCIDHLDGIFGPGDAFPFADVHIAASHAGMARASEYVAEAPDDRLWPGAQIMHLTHHADPRIMFRDHSGDGGLRVGYFGLPKNTRIPEALQSRFSDADLEHKPDFPLMLRRMESANFHYAVRPFLRARARGAAVYKPFTKGFNAARAGANIIVNRDADDALEYLGDDYPYLVDGGDDGAIADAMERADAGFGGPEWRRGLEAMAEVRRRTTYEHIATELRSILEYFG